MLLNSCRIVVCLLLVVRQALCCIDTTSPEWEARQHYNVSCPNGGEIVSLTVSSGLGRCPVQSNTGCRGLTAYIIEEHLNCHWHQSCLVRIPRWDVIDIIVKTKSTECFGKNPEFLQLSDAFCFKPSGSKQAIIDSSTEFNVIRHENPTSCKSKFLERGIIRSHHFYPWDYEGTAVFSTSSDEGHYCYELYFKPRSKLIITVKDFDMWEGDSLTISPHRVRADKQVNASFIGQNFVYENEERVQIILSVNTYSRGGRGFVLCFANVDVSRPNVNACAEVVSKATITLEPMQNMVSDATIAPVKEKTKAPAPAAPKDPESCKDCKKRCKKVPKKERKTCRKGCKTVCKKNKKGKGGKKGKKDKKKKKKSKRHLI